MTSTKPGNVNQPYRSRSSRSPSRRTDAAARKIPLFCFPYAGGSGIIYRKWQHLLAPELEVVPIELSGRGRRIRESFYGSLVDAVDDVFQYVLSHLSDGPYAFFGHSMGSLIAYELALKIRAQGLPAPVHLFFSGRGAPDVQVREREQFHRMSGTEFEQKLLRLGGTPREVFDHPELLEMLMPVLKNDFRIAETYRFQGRIQPFESDISVFIGKSEDLGGEEIHAWRNHTSRICHVYYLEGDHFFINSETERVVDIINRTLAPHMTTGSEFA